MTHIQSVTFRTHITETNTKTAGSCTGQWCCQTNANSSQCGMNVVVLCSTKLTPFFKSSVALQFEIVS